MDHGDQTQAVRLGSSAFAHLTGTISLIIRFFKLLIESDRSGRIVEHVFTSSKNSDLCRISICTPKMSLGKAVIICAMLAIREL